MFDFMVLIGSTFFWIYVFMCFLPHLYKSLLVLFQWFSKLYLLYIDLKMTSLWYLKAKLETSCIYLCGFEVFGIGSTFMSLKSVTWDPPDPWHPPPLLLQLSRVLIPTNYHLGRCWWRQMAGWLVRTAQLPAHANTRTLVRRNMLSDTPGHR